MKTTENIINTLNPNSIYSEVHKAREKIKKIESYLQARPWESASNLGLLPDTVVSQIKAAKQKVIELREYVTLLEKYLNETNGNSTLRIYRFG